MQTGERQASVNPDYEKRSWLTLGLFACFKTSKMESSITATPPSCQGKGEKGINSVRYVCLVIPICISLFCERFSKFVITIFCYAQGPIIAWLYKLPMKKSCTGSLCPSCLSLLSLSLFFFLQLSQFIKYSRESARQLLVWASLCHIDEARDLCRAHSLSGYNNTWSLSPVRARIKEKNCSLRVVN